jgi:hypothetical protein
LKANWKTIEPKWPTIARIFFFLGGGGIWNICDIALFDVLMMMKVHVNFVVQTTNRIIFSNIF